MFDGCCCDNDMSRLLLLRPVCRLLIPVVVLCAAFDGRSMEPIADGKATTITSNRGTQQELQLYLHE